MSASVSALRRRALACLAATLVLALPAMAAAQDARTTEVQAAARAWLAHADRLDGATTWKLAGAKFRGAVGSAAWSKALRATRAPLGALQQRAAVSTRFDSSFGGAPPGDYALVQFRTAFEKKSEGHETVTMERESDGAWRVIGYFIR